jgi:transposase-like protein
MSMAQVMQRFPTREDCVVHLEKVLWKGHAICPYCQSDHSTLISKKHRHHCNNCNSSYSVTVGTFLHHTHLPLQKWFLAITLIMNAKEELLISQLAKQVDVDQNTALRMEAKIRDAISKPKQRMFLIALIEANET